MTAADITLIERAAALLDDDASELRQCHNVDPQHPDWNDEPDAKAMHDEALATAAGLRALATQMKGKELPHG